MTFHVITLFPNSFNSYVSSSIIGRALRNKKIQIKYYNPRDFTLDKWKRIDHKPYGGGPGMVIEALPVIKAVEKALRNTRYGVRDTKKTRNSKLVTRNSLIVWLSPNGKQYDNKQAEKFSKYTDIIIICGRYEGIDVRVIKMLKAITPPKRKINLSEMSVGPYVLTGGELPAMVILDTVARRIPGVLGKIESIEENRITSSEIYTRPEILEHKGKKYRVPKILLSGHHQKIDEWKRRK